MAQVFKLPDIGEGISEVELLQWYVQEGEVVREDQPLAEIETDKAVADLPSPYAGTIQRLHYQSGDRIPVGAVLVSFAEGQPSPQPSAAASGRASEESPTTEAARLPAGQPRQESVHDGASPEPRTGRVLATPATRRRARELGVDLAAVHGSGPAGRITLEDVERFARDGEHVAVKAEVVSAEALAPTTAPARPPSEHLPQPDFAQWGPVERLPLSATRRQIARKMVQSMLTIPHAAALDEADVTELEAFRRRATQQLHDPAVHLTLLPFVMKAAAAALKRFPSLNASLDDEQQTLILKHYYHLGIAVDTERGLIVPVIRDVDRKSIAELAAELAEKAERTRAGKISLEDLRGGSFTLTNAGAIGGHTFIPIINHPEVAILGLGRAQPKPVVREGQVVIRTMLPLSLAFDHRVVDGAEVLRFLTLLMRWLEDPTQLWLET